MAKIFVCSFMGILEFAEWARWLRENLQEALDMATKGIQEDRPHAPRPVDLDDSEGALFLDGKWLLIAPGGAIQGAFEVGVWRYGAPEYMNPVPIQPAVRLAQLDAELERHSAQAKQERARARAVDGTEE